MPANENDVLMPIWKLINSINPCPYSQQGNLGDRIDRPYDRRSDPMTLSPTVGSPELQLYKSIKTIAAYTLNCSKVANFSAIQGSRPSDA
jgi:hypothetical protein